MKTFTKEQQAANKKVLIAALRGGKYKEARGLDGFREGQRYCVRGVMYDLCDPTCWDLESAPGRWDWWDHGNKWSDVDTSYVFGIAEYLVEDDFELSGLTFKQIAKNLARGDYDL